MVFALLGCEKEKIAAPPVIYGHGGISLSDERAVFPPNSDESIRYALDALNADGVEVDVQLTADSKLVLFHDDYLDDVTNQTGCISQFTWEEISQFEYYGSRRILLLSNVISEVMKRNKYLIIDMKHHSACTNDFIDFDAANLALEKVLKNVSDSDKQRITINSRNLKLLVAIQDSTIKKSYETTEVEPGIEYAEQYNLDKLCIKLDFFSEDKAQLLRTAELDYCLFNIKTRGEIKDARSYNPPEIITDNISASRKLLYYPH